MHQLLLSNRVNYWTGSQCREFEQEFAGWCGVPHAVALANGTLERAWRLSLRILAPKSCLAANCERPDRCLSAMRCLRRLKASSGRQRRG
ncbi:hypothetical protein DAMDJJ_19495 [Cupriavidus necator]